MTTVALAVLGLVAPNTAHAADPTVPGFDPDAPLPATVTADALPTWQINGVVWSQAIVGNTAYVTGSFTKARPPGVAAGGAGEVTANNIFAFDITTGNRVASFNHSLNAQGLVIRASADGTKLYVGGDFTTVDGQARGHIASFDLPSGALNSFAPNIGGQVRGIGVTPTAVYAGGNFMSVNGQNRTRLAAFQRSNGALLNWAPAAEGGYVWALVMSPDNTKVIPGGSFTTLNGQPAYGMGSVDASDGSSNPWPAQDKIRTAGKDGAITSLKTDGTNVFGTSYAFGAGASFEGPFSINPNSGEIVWANDCLGDTYDIGVMGQVAYNASHMHDCTVINSFTDTNPRSRWQKAQATTAYPTHITTKNDVYGWNFIGVPYATDLQWYPNFAFGSYTASRQGPWAVDGSADGRYLVMGGEFPSVNGVAQQGLVRFTTRANNAPKKRGPTYSTVPATPVPATTAVSFSAGTARVSFGTAWDMDNPTLKYEVLRDNAVWLTDKTQEIASSFWSLPRGGFFDTGLAPGSTHRYQMRITDADGNVLWSPVSNTVTIAATNTQGAYGSAVMADGAAHYWPLGEASGAVGLDYVAFDDLAFTGGFVRATTPGALANDPASTFNGSDALAAAGQPIVGPDVFTVEAWFRTTTTAGGKIVGFGDRNTSTSSNYDRHIYMDPDGKLTFGVWNNGAYTVTTPTAMNDGQWHHAVGTMDPSGVTLFVDGVKIGKNGGTSTAQPYSGYWRVGGDSSWAGNAYFAGDIDEVAIYPTALDLTKVRAHYTTSGRSAAWPVRPADSYGQAVWDSNPEIYWRMDDAAGPLAADSSPNGVPGTYQNQEGSGHTYQIPAGVQNGTASAVAFDGAEGTQLVSGQSFANPNPYSAELWFKTTTTVGGKLIGFGCSQTGRSGCYDRHVWMGDDGRLSFGAWTGQMNLAITPASYNDGQWHHVVATQGSDGMKLYVDGVLRATNPQVFAEGYTGWWRLGGDNGWGGSSSYFNGVLDEAAIYSHVLTPETVLGHFAAGGGQLANQDPTAAFTSTTSPLAVSVDASTSADPDGTIASYAWDFGDGTSGSGVTAAHTYASAGTYTVRLTVTDNRGGTNSVTHDVVVAVNQAPVASFTTTNTFLSVTSDGSGSTDADGTLATYAWQWGDGETGTGATATHTYAAAGTYTITLTVTDNLGATAAITTDVTVLANVAPTASFTSSVRDLTASVDGSTSTDSDGTVVSYAWNWGDATPDASGATASHAYAAPGTYPVTLTVTDNAGATATSTAQVTVTAPPNVAPVAAFSASTSGRTVSVNGSGSSDPDGNIASYAWNWGDGGTGTGVTATHAFAPGTYTVTLTVTDNRGAAATTTKSVTIVNAAPVASFSVTSNALVVTVTGAASSDPDGSIAGYSWNWGDGTATSSGATALHTYAAAGSYTVTLTVTDNEDATSVTTRSVNVTAVVTYASDSFQRTVSGGWGNADQGGPWTLAGPASVWSVTGSEGQVVLPKGSGYTAFLGSMSQVNTETSLGMSVAQLPGGSGLYSSVIGRRISATADYRAKLRIASNGQVTAYLVRMSGTTETTLATPVTLPTAIVAGESLQIRLQVAGTSPTTLNLKVWRAVDPEPATWLMTASDATAGHQVAGSVGFYDYLSGSSGVTPVTIRKDNLWIGAPKSVI